MAVTHEERCRGETGFVPPCQYPAGCDVDVGEVGMILRGRSVVRRYFRIDE